MVFCGKFFNVYIHCIPKKKDHLKFIFFMLLLFLCYRISGNAASTKNIHGTVSEQLKKNFAKSRWKVLVNSFKTFFDSDYLARFPYILSYISFILAKLSAYA